jgi:hypothetical protein
MDQSAIPKWLDVNNAKVMQVVDFFANPVAKFGVSPTRHGGAG